MTSILYGLDKKKQFFWGVLLVQVQKFCTGNRYALKFCIRMVKDLKLKVKSFWELIPTFVEPTEEKPVPGVLLPLRSHPE